jgi:hypothetical protein
LPFIAVLKIMVFPSSDLGLAISRISPEIGGYEVTMVTSVFVLKVRSVAFVA